MERGVASPLEEKKPAVTEVVLLGETGFDWSFNCGGCCVGCGSSELLKRVVGESLHEQRKEHWVTMMLGGASLASVCLVPGFGEPICCNHVGCCGHHDDDDLDAENESVVVGEAPPILNSDVASTTGIRALFETVRSMEAAFFKAQSAADLARVALLCQHSLSAAADVVARLHPEEMKGVDIQNPVVAIHVLDTFFGSRIGNNLDDPSRKMIRSTLVLTYDIQAGGFRDRAQASVTVESVRFIVGAFLLLV